MDGIKDFRKFQIGRERKNGGAAGTPVAATAIMRGIWMGADDTPITYPEEYIGRIGEINRSYMPYVLGSAKQGPDPVTFEQLPYILSAAIRGIDVGQADGAGSGKIYHYSWPQTPESISLTATTLSFTASTKTIADSGNNFGFLQAGDLIQVSGAGEGDNNDVFRVVTASASSITVSEAVADESAGEKIKIEVLEQVYTFEGGNNKRVEQAAYCFPTSFELFGKGGANADALMLSSAWTVKQWIEKTAGFTSGIALPALSEALFTGCRLFIDDIGGTMGATEALNTLSSFDYKANTGIAHQFAGNGSLGFAKAQRKGKVQLSCALSLYQNDIGQAEYDHWRANDPRLIRIQVDGPALATAGSAYSKKTILIDMPGTWSKFPQNEDIEGAEVLPGQFRPAYDVTAGIGPSITVVNELTALP